LNEDTKQNQTFKMQNSDDVPMQACSFLPQSLFDPAVKPKANLTNVKFTETRKLIETDEKTKNSWLACFCKDKEGLQLPALKKTARTYLCHYANIKNNPSQQQCGFRINQDTLTHLDKHKILKHNSLMRFPICKICAGSWLILSTSEKNRDAHGGIQYICNCDPYSHKINIPIDDDSVSKDFNLDNYYLARKSINPSFKTDIANNPASSAFYIPE
jgi:hypothetical protein